MKKRIWMFVLSCIMLVTLCAGLVNCQVLDGLQYEVKYIVDGEVYYSQMIYADSEVLIPADPTRVDYDFDGWYYDEDTWMRPFKFEHLTNGHSDSNIVVYAKWVPHEHKILNGELNLVKGEIVFTGSCVCGKDEFTIENIKKETTVAPTCLAEGYNTHSCTVLGETYTFIETLPKGNHAINGVDVSVYLDENGYISCDVEGVFVYTDEVASFNCGDTAPGMFICTHCGGSLDVNVAKNHQYNKWTMVPYGSGENSYYELSSTCERAECRNHNVYVAEERYLTEEVILNASCSKEGILLATYNNDVITVTCDVVIPMTAHLYNGIPLDQLETTNGAYNYYDSKGNVVFDKNFTNIDTAECGGVYATYYECVCEQLIRVEVYKNHKLDKGTTVIPATCISDGLKKQLCLDCGHYVESVIKATGHNYKYQLILIEDNDSDFTNDVFNYVGVCSGCGLTKGATTVYYKDLKHTIKPATCTTPGSHTYEYSGTKLVVEIPANDEHILNGVIAKYIYADKNGVTGDGFSYRYSIDGIEIFGNVEFMCSVKSGELYNGYYQCEACKVIVSVDVFVDHLGTRTTVSQPTCSTDGTVRVDCVDCGKNQVTEILATGAHTYAYSLKVEEELTGAITYTLLEKCEICEHTNFTELVPADIKIEVVREVSCQHDGIYGYTYTNGKINVYTEEHFGTKGEHTLNGKYISELLNSHGQLESSVSGIILPAGVQYKIGDVVSGAFICEHCGSSVKIDVLIVDKKED